MAPNLIPANPDLAGITQKHLSAIAKKCREDNVFLIVRPSEKETMTLINNGFACKNMDIHDKSSNWGLMAGMVPVDPRFSKKKLGTGITNSAVLKKSHGQAQSVHLKFEQGWMKLIGDHFKVNSPVKGLNVKCKCGGSYESKTTHGTIWKKDWVHYPDPINEVCFLMDPDKKVYWRWLDENKNTNIPKDGVPLYVWAYNGIPVTGDYDVWMLAPHVQSPEIKDSIEIDSQQDNAGRSAATKLYTKFLQKLNIVCQRATGGNVFHHGAEAQNVSFTQELNVADRSNTVFCPGEHEPFMVNNNDLPLLIYEMLEHGYMATLNPKWSRGMTLGAEDMAYVRDQQIGWDAAIIERNQQGIRGSDAVANLETEAALKIQRLFRSRKPSSAGITNSFKAVAHNAEMGSIHLRNRVRKNEITESEAIDILNQSFWEGMNRGMALTIYHKTKFDDRLNKVALMRKIAKAALMEPGHSEFDGDYRFPITCFKVEDDVAQSVSNAQKARALAKVQEKSLGRTEFIPDDHGGWIPVDRTKDGAM